MPAAVRATNSIWTILIVIVFLALLIVVLVISIPLAIGGVVLFAAVRAVRSIFKPRTPREENDELRRNVRVIRPEIIDAERANTPFSR